MLDARDPIGCRCLEMEKTILDSGHKKIVLLLNKIGNIYLYRIESILLLGGLRLKVILRCCYLYNVKNLQPVMLNKHILLLEPVFLPT